MPALYMVRHGETSFNVEQRLQGRYETRLNARGRQQASACGHVLLDLFGRDGRRPQDFGYVSSPLMRARETMELMRATLGLEPAAYAVDDRLMEISYGGWEGLTLDEIGARDADLLAHRERDKWLFEPPGGESYRDVANRVAAWYATVARDSVVTCHGGVVRALMANFHLVPLAEATHANIRHGVVYVFSAGTLARYP